ncbi:hypothetical protein [Xenorhabdus bovienii]|uniref:hypothetical protein n=1 Tax=Xenorhabdus bovienii TaxID=40576 RepID=UPI0023B296CF|nr:hypothetical protein [Xenorhabdus bovienii]MDE9465465.1 hypothetical protein [Xenorhabdus bovienii]MDE9540395.1 hypothetical protein [Xenorhabdus bovienii]
MRRVIVIITVIIFFVTCYFSVRELVSFFWIIPLSILAVTYSYKIGVIASCSLVVVICVASLLWVNSMTPIFGDGYTQRVEIEEKIDRVQKQEYEDVGKVSTAQYSVKESLKDPSSAEFSGDRLGNNGAVCGYVNAKNSLGAYTGKQRYVSNNGLNTIDDNSPEFESIWMTNCQ